MDQFSYNRQYELIVSKPINELNNVADDYRNTPLQDAYVVYSPSDDSRTVNKRANLTITDLHIEANIEASSKTSGSKGSNCTIKIFNLSKDDRAFIESDENCIILNAGYRNTDTFDGIYSGNIKSAYTEKQGKDVITTLVCEDGYTPSSAVRISYYKKKGSSYKDVLEDLANIWVENGIGKGEIITNEGSELSPIPSKNPSDTLLERSFVFSGKLRKAMDVVCDAIGYKWQIVNSLLFIEPMYNENRKGLVKVSTDNIISIDNKTGDVKETSNSQDKKGITIMLLLDGRINTSKNLEILDGDKKGTYIINGVSHSLSYEGNDWYTTAECSGESNGG